MNDIIKALRNTNISSRSYKGIYKFIIYGAGNFGKDVFGALTGKGFSVAAFLDQNAKQGDNYNKVPILKPGDNSLFSIIEKQDNISVIIAIHNRNVEIFTVIEYLRTIGYHKILTPVDLFDICGEVIGNRYWLTSKSYYRQYEDEIKKAFYIWKDDISKSLYKNVLAYRITGNYNISLVSDQERQYFPSDIPSWKKPLRFIDCGAYTGDTIHQFINAGFPIQAVAAFEPDQNNFRKLCGFMEKKKSLINDILLWPCCVHGSTERFSFTSAIGESAGLSLKGDTIIQCVALDDAIPNFRPNLIKMDIEGTEYDAIQGARKIIEENKPGLAISVYHRPDDLWRIPLLIHQWNYGYDFYLRLHAYNGFDLVMYAVN